MSNQGNFKKTISLLDLILIGMGAIFGSAASVYFSRFLSAATKNPGISRVPSYGYFTPAGAKNDSISSAAFSAPPACLMWDTTVASLREAVSQTDGNLDVLKRVKDMQEHIKQAGGAEKAADEIESFLAPAGVK